MTKLYLAGPLFSLAEQRFNVDLARFLKKKGFKVWLPQAHEPRDKTAKAIFDMDVEGLDWADMVVACMDGPDPDSGTAWECGYAFGKGKPVVCYRTDFRIPATPKTLPTISCSAKAQRRASRCRSKRRPRNSKGACLRTSAKLCARRAKSPSARSRTAASEDAVPGCRRARRLDRSGISGIV